MMGRSRDVTPMSCEMEIETLERIRASMLARSPDETIDAFLESITGVSSDKHHLMVNSVLAYCERPSEQIAWAYVMGVLTGQETAPPMEEV